ncbi:GNAT family N-acetyltransferase [Thermodesulfobacteriota bacterium]
MAAKHHQVEMPLREAGRKDIPLLAIHHRKMFEEIWEKKGENIDESKFEEMEKAYIEKLKRQFSDGACKAWVIEDGAHIIASGALSRVGFVPIPNDSSFHVAYLHSMYSEKEYRQKRCAMRIINEAIGYSKAMGIKRIILNASEAGKPVYEKAGFQPVPDSMRLFIE